MNVNAALSPPSPSPRRGGRGRASSPPSEVREGEGGERAARPIRGSSVASIASACVHDFQTDAVSVGQDLRIPEVNDRPICALKMGGTPSVIRLGLLVGVRVAVHHEARLRAGEIPEVVAERELPLPSPSAQAMRVERAPEIGLSARVVAAQLARAIDLSLAPNGADGVQRRHANVCGTSMQAEGPNRPLPTLSLSASRGERGLGRCRAVEA